MDYLIKKMSFRSLLHRCRCAVILLSKYFFSIVPKQKDLILFSAWFGQKYADSSMYMYEYLLEHTRYQSVWFTRNKDVYNTLKSKCKPVIYSRSLKAFWYLLRAKMYVSSIQFSDFPHYFLTNCIYFDLDHGFQVKEGPELSQQILSYTELLRKNVDYYHSASSYFCMNKVSSYYHVEPTRVALVNKPRMDVLFDSRLRAGYNDIVDQLKGVKKAIVWMPTHRSDGTVSIDVSKLLDLNKIQELCEKRNAVFFIKKHYYHKNEVSDLEGFSRIFDITNEEIETQTLLYQADVLITDYSSCYIDYLALDRPIILYAYDMEDYLSKERNIFVPFSENNVGPKVLTTEQLCEALDTISLEWRDDNHSEGRKELKRMFFSDSLKMGKAREETLQVMTQMLNKAYLPEWSKKYR